MVLVVTGGSFSQLPHICRYVEEFDKRHCKMCAISCDDVDSHVEWTKDICASQVCPAHAGGALIARLMGWLLLAVQGCAELGFAIIADPTREICTDLGMLGAFVLLRLANTVAVFGG